MKIVLIVAFVALTVSCKKQTTEQYPETQKVSFDAVGVDNDGHETPSGVAEVRY